VLIKAVLQNILVYWSTLAKFPSFIKKRIRQIITNLLWKRAKNPSGFHLASWSQIAKPKHQGGWGIRDLDLFNKALAAKSMWRALFHKQLWSALMRNKYLKGIEVVSWLRKENVPCTKVSIVWRNLLTTLVVIKLWVAWRVDFG